MPCSKSAISTLLAPFKRQCYRSWYIDGYPMAEFTELMNQLLEELQKITFVRLHVSQRQWRGCKRVWDEGWNIEEGGPFPEARRELDNLHIWFCKAPNGGVMYKPLKLDWLTLSSLLPGLGMGAEIRHSEAQYQSHCLMSEVGSDMEYCAAEYGAQYTVSKTTTFEREEPAFDESYPSTISASNEDPLSPTISFEPFDQTASTMQNPFRQGFFPSFQLNGASFFGDEWGNTFETTTHTPSLGQHCPSSHSDRGLNAQCTPLDGSIGLAPCATDEYAWPDLISHDDHNYFAQEIPGHTWYAAG